MPKRLAGYELAVELWRLLCAAFEKLTGKKTGVRMLTGPEIGQVIKPTVLGTGAGAAPDGIARSACNP